MKNQLVLDNPDSAEIGQKHRLPWGNSSAVELRAAMALKIDQDE
jgi:hypothetical protein